jgi:hypothetical protein
MVIEPTWPRVAGVKDLHVSIDQSPAGLFLGATESKTV